MGTVLPDFENYCRSDLLRTKQKCAWPDTPDGAPYQTTHSPLLPAKAHEKSYAQKPLEGAE